MKTTKIAVHHTGPLSPTKTYESGIPLPEYQINNAHKARDFNLSEMGFYIGYNVVIQPDGSWKQYRLLGEQTAAATGSNFDTFHICLVGNFTKWVESPTTQQVATLKTLIITLIENKPESFGIKVRKGQDYSFSAYNIFPHRVLQPNHTSCYGSVLGDNWARNFAFEYLKQKHQSNLFLYKMLCTLSDYFNGIKLGMIKSLGSSDHSDEGIIYNDQ